MTPMPSRVLRILIATLCLGLLGASASGLLYKPTALEGVQQSGVLRVVTVAGPATLSHTSDGPTGLEYDLARAFADYLGVELDMLVASSKADVYHALATGSADLAAAGLSPSEARNRHFRFTESYLSVEQHVIYRFGQRRPETVADLAAMDSADLQIAAYGSQIERLQHLRGDYPELSWNEVASPGTEELLYRVWNREAELTVVDSIDLQLTQHFYPELRIAFTLEGARDLVWAFRNGRDDTLYRASGHFFEQMRNSGRLAQIEERYLGHLGQFDYVGARVFLRHITERLPEYREVFKEAAARTGVDWRLLAAIGYQESHWNPRAVSPTGVRGIMMLTLPTAREMGIEDRLDPVQSIDGGARYFASLRQRIPERIEEPVRTWLALAAYNVGMGHLEDARRLTEIRGGDPDTWKDIKDSLPLLSQREWYEQTRFGYARGQEPVTYVAQIRTYYDLLTRITDPEPGTTLVTVGRPYEPEARRRALNLAGLLQSTL